jgi:IS605 OrfB family transposase
MNVLSLFDGMSCGQIALKELRIEPDIYYASEIDKFAIKQTQLNFPDTIQLGDVRNIKVADLEKIDLILGGSPCYNLSMIGKREGLSTKENIEVLSLEQYLDLKSKGVEFTGQSYLFWEFVRILEEAKKINPNVLFLLENVEMGKKNNQKFVQIPFARLVSYLEYKCELAGIEIVIHEESYTSKCDSLAFEKIGRHDSYLGRRKKRGLFQSSVGKLINADVNGALNIMRKVVGDSCESIRRIIDRGLLFNPVRITNVFC